MRTSETDDDHGSCLLGNGDPVRTGACVVFPCICGSDGRIEDHHYFDVLDDSSFLFWDLCGLGRGALAARGLATVIGRYELSVHHRAKAGDALSVQSRIMRIGTRSVLLEHDIVEIENQTHCATAQGTHVFFDLAARRSATIPDEVREFLRTRTRTHRRSPRRDWASERPAVSSDEYASRGASWEIVSGGIVESDHCDHLGHLNARFHARLFAEAVDKIRDPRHSAATSEIRESCAAAGERRIRIDYDSEALKTTRYQVRWARETAERPESTLDLRLVDRDREVTLSRCRWSMPQAADGAESSLATRSGCHEKGVEQ